MLPVTDGRNSLTNQARRWLFVRRVHEQHWDIRFSRYGIGDISEKEPGDTNLRACRHGDKIDFTVSDLAQYSGNRILIKTHHNLRIHL